MGDPSGEADRVALRLDFNRRLMLQFRGSAITSDAGLLAYRELDDTLRLTEAGADGIADARTGKKGRHRLAGLRQSVFGRLAGYEDVNDADRLCHDLGGRRPSDHRICCLSQPDWALRDQVAEPTREPFGARRSARPVDRQGTSATPAEGDCARPGFEREPDLRRAGRQCLQWPFRLHLLSPAVRVQPARRCVHSADGWRAVLEPVIARYRGIALPGRRAHRSTPGLLARLYTLVVRFQQMIPARNYRHARESGHPGRAGTAFTALAPHFRGVDGKRGVGNHLFGSYH
jgi:Transposase DDE domain group 1